jgi:hypothetical protein
VVRAHPTVPPYLIAIAFSSSACRFQPAGHCIQIQRFKQRSDVIELRGRREDVTPQLAGFANDDSAHIGLLIPASGNAGAVQISATRRAHCSKA